MAALSAIAKQCTNLAGARAPALLARAIDHAVASLQEEEQRCTSVAQRRELADAWLELTRRRDDWAQRYPDALERARASNPAPTPAAKAGTDRFGGLALVEDDALSNEIESARVLQLIAPRLEQALTEFDSLMSTALGLETVQPERNPLRPQVFARALQELMQAPPQPELPKLWARHLANPLANEIEALYREALALLRNARLEAATYRVLPTASAVKAAAPVPAQGAAPQAFAAGAATGGHAAGAGTAGGGSGSSGGSGGGAGGGGGGGFGTGANASGGSGAPGAPDGGVPGSAGAGGGPGGAPGTAFGGSAWADLSGYQLGDALFQEFLYARAQPSTQALAPSYYASVDAQIAATQEGAESFEPYDLQAVQQHRALSPVERPARHAGTTRELDDAVWGRWAPARERSLHRSRLKKQARQVGQVLGLEVVRKVVDQVAQDPRLLAPVREAIVALEPALLRLALAAPRFFAQEDHAGRRLVERVAERSFRYNDEFGTEFHEFFAGVRSAFQGLNEQDVEDDAPFAQALDRLEEHWSGEDALEEHGHRVAVDAIHFAEAREAEAAQIAWSLSQRSDLEGVPAVVQDFLYGPWSLVLAHARLTDESKQMDPGGWNGVITDLLWSVKPEQTLRDPARLITTIPGMLDRLRKGVAMLGQEPAENDSFFGALEKLHSPVLKLRARTRKSGPLSAAANEPQLDPALLSTQKQQPRAAGGDPWLTPNELKVAGFEEEAPAAEASSAAPLAPAAQPAMSDEHVADLIAALHEGCWVDLYARKRWRRARLTWVSTRATLFMFVSNGGQPHSMTRRSLERLLRERLLRPVESGGVVPRAIDALSQAREAPASATPARASAARRGNGEIRLAA